METGSSKYDRIIRMLRNSKPEYHYAEILEEKVLGAVSTPDKKGERYSFLDYLFGWVYVGWMRKALIGIAFFFVGLFIYQQSQILRRLTILESRTVQSAGQFVNFYPATSFERITALRLKGRQIPVDKKQVKELIDSYNELENKYKDLMKIIENDPILKQMLEDKMNEKKFKL